MTAITVVNKSYSAYGRYMRMAFDTNIVEHIVNSVIGASLSEPHHVRSTVKSVFLLDCLLDCLLA